MTRTSRNKYEILSDATWCAVVTVAIMGNGDYYPVTVVRLSITIFIMLSGSDIFVLLGIGYKNCNPHIKLSSKNKMISHT